MARHNKIDSPRKLLLIYTVNYRSHALRGNVVFDALRPVFTTQSISGCVTTRSVGTMKIRANLETRGLPIGQHDLLIAAHALSLDLTVITANEREFTCVENLTVENWLTS